MRNATLFASAAMLLPACVYAQQTNGDVGASVANTDTIATVGTKTARSNSDASSGIAEIIVTAEKRGESVQAVPAAVTAFSGKSLESIGITDQSALGQISPGLIIGAQTGFAITFIRGVGQTQAAPNNIPAVSINLDGMYLPPESGFTPLYDLQRVETIPGPQGTLYGRSSAGGAINLITNQPTQDFSGDVRAELGNYRSVMATGEINVPLGEGFAVRVAGFRQEHNPYLSNGLDDEKTSSIRSTLSYDSPGFFHGTLMVQNDFQDGTGNSAISYTGNVPNAHYPHPGNLYDSTIPNFGQNYYFHGLEIAGNFELDLDSGLKLTYVPGYSSVRDRQYLDLLTLFPATFWHRVDQTTQELRLSGTRGDDDWLAGLYWLDAPNHTLASNIPLFGPAAANGITRNSLTSYAGFGEYRYRPFGALRLTFGGRYSFDKFAGHIYNAIPPYTAADPLDVYPSDSRGHFDFKVGVDYQIAKDSLLYAVVQTGSIPAGFDQNGDTLKPSELTSYTVGSKNEFLHGMLTENIELFYYDYRDFQLQYNVGFLFGSTSVPARIFGAEWQSRVRLGPNDSLTLGALFQDAEMLKQSALYTRNELTTSTLVNVTGYQLPDAPVATLNGSFSHTFPLPNNQRLVGLMSFHYSSDYWESFTHDLYTNQTAYTKTDISLTYYSHNDRWSLGAFVRNLENQAVIVGSSKSQGPGLTGAPYLQAPRTFGMEFEANF